MVKPTRFQWKIWWAALTAIAFAVLAGFATGVGWIIASAISFLQPVLLPLAVAGILAYLLDPVVGWLCSRNMKRTWAVVAVFAAFFAVVAGIAIWIVPPIHRQAVNFAEKLPTLTQRAQVLVNDSLERLRAVPELPVFRSGEEGEERDPIAKYLAQGIDEGIVWLQNKAPDFAVSAGNFLLRGLGGALGIFGLLISLILVPVFLFFFLKEGPGIAASWSNYLPLRASPLKSEVVSLLNEINGYLIAFFRGQLLVSMIDGAITAIALLVLGMEFAVLIGLMVGILGLIPYAGVFISWIPAVLIAAAQWGDWLHPLIVTIIFLAVNNLDGIIIAPRIVGESVGLHPLTVILSVLIWSIVLGGLIGALLAVPLTATLKVLLKRYFWDRPAEPEPAPG